jgi:hypothetical protein
MRKRRLTGKSHMGGTARLRSSSITPEFAMELQLLDATDVIQVVRRPDDTVWLDMGDTDPDTAILLLVKGLLRIGVLQVMEEYEVVDDLEDEDEDEG